jgi:uncharacterized protein (TIGR00255 family)
VVAPLLELPGVVRTPEDGNGIVLVAEDVRRLAVRAVTQALEALQRSRGEEGEVVAAVLRDHGVTLQDRVSKVAARAPEVPGEQRDRLVQRVRTLLDGVDPQVSVSESDLLREICLLSDRADVTEELNRLRGHLALYERILSSDGEVGRRLEFLLQEILRETNTLGSKANDTGIAHAVVDMKVEIERMKEQVQNLE